MDGRARSTAGPEPAAVSVSPEPEVDELVALTAALATALHAPAVSGLPRLSAWATAGRREARLGIAGGARSGWGRARPAFGP